MSRRAILLLCLALAIAPLAAADPLVRVGVFGLFHPRELAVHPADGGVLIVECGGKPAVLEGSASARFVMRGGSLECISRQGRRAAISARVRGRGGADADFILSVPGKLERRYRGVLEVRARGRELEAVVGMDRELAVASAVAAESPPGAPLEALKAQAVVTRSYYAAARGRHHDFDFCDTTHCQFLREAPQPGDPAWLATQATRGWVLAYAGATVPALYSASCGGRTRTPAELGMRSRGYPYYSVECPYCREHAQTWESRLDPAQGKPLLSGKSEQARMRLGRELGWSAVPGANYEARLEGGEVVVRGRGAGHGIGLCQAGAAGMAARGAGFRQILEHYFPNTALVNLEDRPAALGH